MSHIIIRPATSADLFALAEIERQSFAQPWSESALQSELAREDTVLLTAELSGEVIGWAGLQCCLDEGSVTNIAVLPQYRRMGAGRTLTKALLQEATKRRLSSVTLEVRVGNAAAIALYESLGFGKLGIRPGFYSLPTEDALMMQCKLASLFK